METQKLVAGLLAQFTPAERHDRHRLDELEHIIDVLHKQQEELKQRLARETSHAQLRRLKIAFEVNQLQYRKALAMRPGQPAAS